MAGSSIGQIFRLTTFGESHGVAVGGVIDGCPAGVKFDPELVRQMMDRRRPGRTKGVSPRNEADKVEWLSGIFEGYTTGIPIAFTIRNSDARSGDYDSLKDVYRPSHADLTYELKYGRRDHRGGGRASARETAARVAAASIAMMFLRETGIEINAASISIGKNKVDYPDWVSKLNEPIKNPLFYIDDSHWKSVEQELNQLQDSGDSTGGKVGCVVRGMHPGLGEPVFDKLSSSLAAAMMSLPAAKGFEIGSGFSAADRLGSEENDPYIKEDGTIRTKFNRSGGIQGGISNGEDLVFTVAFKPASSISLKQSSVDKEGNPVEIQIEGRHDPCVVPRAVPVVEAMTALVLADLLLRSKASK